DMNRDQITGAIQKMFEKPLKNGEQRHIVFWVDQKKEFMEEVKEINIEHVKRHILTENNQFYTKYLLEEEDPNTSYLIYTDVDINSEQSWLRDTALYSHIFYADRLSMIADELQVDSALRAVIQKYTRFFNNRERYKKFKAHHVGTYTKEKIEL